MGKFLAMDEDVADFVEEVQSTGRYVSINIKQRLQLSLYSLKSSIDK